MNAGLDELLVHIKQTHTGFDSNFNSRESAKMKKTKTGNEKWDADAGMVLTEN